MVVDVAFSKAERGGNPSDLVAGPTLGISPFLLAHPAELSA